MTSSLNTRVNPWMDVQQASKSVAPIKVLLELIKNKTKTKKILK